MGAQELDGQGDEGRPFGHSGAISGRGWNAQKKAQFLEVLEDTLNVSAAARAVGMSARGAYQLKRRDHAFAEEWAEILERGYGELEMLLLRQALHGFERVETLDPGNDGPQRTKRVKIYPHAMAIRLLAIHHAALASVRAAQGGDRPDAEALRQEIQRRIAQMKARVGRAQGDADG